jgi:hypothetical protein
MTMRFSKLAGILAAGIGLPLVLGGSQCTQTIEQIAEVIPEFTSEPSGPTGTVTDPDFKRTSISLDLKNWTGTDESNRTRIFLDYSTEGLAPGTITSNEVCAETGGGPRDCTFDFPNYIDNGGTAAFAVGDTVSYRWSIDYKLPEGDPNDVATVTSDVLTFTIGPATPCGGGNQQLCTRPDEICVPDPLGDPDVPLSTGVCRIPGP